MQYVDAELFVAGPHQARLSVQGREYSGRPQLDDDFERRLLEASLEPQEAGRLLFAGLFPEGDELLAGYRESLALARQLEQGLRLRLHIASTAHPLLHLLPWELLYDPLQHLALGRSPEIALSRYLGVPLAPPKATVERPKLLVVLSCPSDLADFGLDALDRQAQRQALEKALAPLVGEVEIDFLEGPATVGAIRDHLLNGGFQALHLQAHGLVSPQEALAKVVLEDDDGRARWVDQELLVELLDGHPSLRLVTLIACHGAASAGEDLFSGLGAALVKRGIPAVVAMGREISLAAAGLFTEHFYRHLLRTGQVDAAVNEARLQLHLQPSRQVASQAEWATPVLFMRLADGRPWQPPSDGLMATPPLTPTEDSVRKDQTPETVLKTLLICDLVDSTGLAERLGDRRMGEIFQRHDRLARDLLAQHGGQEVDRADGFLLLFDRPFEAVCFALDFHQAMDELSQSSDAELAFRVGIHLGEVVLLATPAADVARGAHPLEVEGLAKSTVARLMSLAAGGQTMMTAGAFDLARRSVVGTTAEDLSLRWLAHGEYQMQGLAEPIAVYEVGLDGTAPLEAPSGSIKARRLDDGQTILGWRPAQGLEIPQRPSWILDSKLAQGGFGEVWTARHRKLNEVRVFKFCFEAERLRSLQREITLFRLLKEELGERDDIARILDWDFEQAPYFIESEFSSGGDLMDWTAAQGGLATLPMAQRLELVAQVATALAAAHSVGVLHQDIKPRNVLIAQGNGGPPRARLADFGIGGVVNRRRLQAAGITALGLTETTKDASSYGGTRLYLAPELLEGRRATIQSDVYALGVLLYQSVVGDFSRALAPGWRRDIDDPLLEAEIAAAVDGSPERRPSSATQVATALRTLETRRQELAAQQAERQAAQQARAALARSRQRRRWMAVALFALASLAAALLFHTRQVSKESIRANQEAERANQEAERANQAAETARRAVEFLTGVIEAADPRISKGEEVTVLQMVEEAAKSIDTKLDDQPEVKAEMLSILGQTLHRLGRYEKARPLLDKALALRKEVWGPKHPKVAQDLYYLGFLQRVQGKADDAEVSFRRGLEILDAAVGPDRPDKVDNLRGLGALLWQQGDPGEALVVLERALQILNNQATPDDLGKAKVLGNLGGVHHTQGRFDQAEAAFLKALELLEAVQDEEIPRVATLQENLGMTYYYRDRLDEAETHFQESLKLRRQVLDPAHPKIAKILGSLAGLYTYQGRFEEAADLYAQVLEILPQSLGPDHPQIGMTWNNLGGNQYESGALEEAEASYRKALETLQTALGTDHPDVAAPLHGLGRVYIAKQRFDEAEESLRRALALQERHLEPGHPARIAVQDDLSSLTADPPAPPLPKSGEGAGG